MINSKDTKVIKELVTSAVYQVSWHEQRGIIDWKETLKNKKVIEKCFDIVIKEMEEGKI